MFSLICTRINSWVNSGEAGDLRRYRAHYDVIVMKLHASRKSRNPIKYKARFLYSAWGLRKGVLRISRSSTDAKGAIGVVHHAIGGIFNIHDYARGMMCFSSQ